MADRYDEELILGYVEADLTPQQAKAFRQLMIDDPRVAALANQLIADRRALRAGPKEKAPGELLERVTPVLERGMLLDGPPEAGGGDQSESRFQFRRWLVYGGVAAVLLFSGLLILSPFFNGDFSVKTSRTDLAQSRATSSTNGKIVPGSGDLAWGPTAGMGIPESDLKRSTKTPGAKENDEVIALRRESLSSAVAVEERGNNRILGQSNAVEQLSQGRTDGDGGAGGSNALIDGVGKARDELAARDSTIPPQPIERTESGPASPVESDLPTESEKLLGSETLDDREDHKTAPAGPSSLEPNALAPRPDNESLEQSQQERPSASAPEGTNKDKTAGLSVGGVLGEGRGLPTAESQTKDHSEGKEVGNDGTKELEHWAVVDLYTQDVGRTRAWVKEWITHAGAASELNPEEAEADKSDSENTELADNEQKHSLSTGSGSTPASRGFQTIEIVVRASELADLLAELNQDPWQSARLQSASWTDLRELSRQIAGSPNEPKSVQPSDKALDEPRLGSGEEATADEQSGAEKARDKPAQSPKTTSDPPVRVILQIRAVPPRVLDE